MRMVIHEVNGLAPELKLFLESGGWRPAARLVKDDVRRSIYHLPATAERPGLYIKHDHPVVLRDRLKGLWRCKAQQEYAAGLALAAAVVPVVAMLAWGRQGWDSFLISRELTGARSLAEHRVELVRTPRLQQVFLERFSVFIRHLLAAGVRHPDLHAGNLLISGDAAHPEFALVDVYGAAASGIGNAQGAAQVYAFAASILSVCETASPARFFRRLEPITTAAADDRLCAAGQRLRRDFQHRWAGRRLLFLRHGRVCHLQRTPAGRWLRLAAFPADAAQRAWVALSGTAPHAALEWLKRDAKRSLARLAAPAGSLVLKEFRRPGPWGPWRPDRRCWLNTHLCDAVGVPVVRALAWLKCRDGRGVIVFPDAGDSNLHTVLRGPLPLRRRRALLDQLAWTFGRLHAFGIVHGDCKATNFMVVPAALISTPFSPWARRGDETLAMVDTDSLCLRQNVSLSAAAGNLRDCLASFPDGSCLGPYAAGRFIVTYARARGLPHRVRRRLAQAACRTSAPARPAAG